MALPFLAVVTLRDTISLGSLIVAIAVGLGVIVTYFKGVRWKVEAEMREQTIQTLTEGRNAYKLSTERLGAEKDECQKRIGELEGVVKTLEALPQYKDVVNLVGSLDEQAAHRTETAVKSVFDHLEHAETRTVQAFEKHEQRAQERHEAEMAVMDKILNGKA